MADARERIHLAVEADRLASRPVLERRLPRSWETKRMPA